VAASVAAAAFLGAFAACGESAPPRDAAQVPAGPPGSSPRASDPPREPQESALTDSGDRTAPNACIRGGSTREEVRRVMGEPDSISFGAWLYGRSEISFGYGVVVDLSNAGGNLIVC
jgi:hypothetical protein